jgi:hypothetical protein
MRFQPDEKTGKVSVDRLQSTLTAKGVLPMHEFVLVFFFSLSHFLIILIWLLLLKKNPI